MVVVSGANLSLIHILIGEGFAQGVAIVFGAQGRQDRQGKAAAAELLPEVFEAVVLMVMRVYARRHIVYDEYCMPHSSGCQEISLERGDH